MRPIRHLALLLLTFACLAWPQSVTWSEHIAPIIYSNCTSCHRPGQVAPLPMTSFDEVRRRAGTISQTVQSHYMPPWKPEPGWVPYRDERRLTPDQIAMIQKWIDNGMPEGDASKAPKLPVFPEGWQIGTP